MVGAIVHQGDGQIAAERLSIERDGSNTTADAPRIFHLDFVARAAAVERDVEVWPTLWDAWIDQQFVALHAESEQAFSAIWSNPM
jgi:hypothetical protein